MTGEMLRVRIQFINDTDPFAASAYNREPLKPLQYEFPLHRPIGDQLADIIRLLKAPHKKGDCCLQVSSGGSGEPDAENSYLDSDLSLSEQPDELHLLQSDPMRSGLVLRQQPSLRMKSIIDKLLYMSGRDQKRALFSLKTIFQNDKDLVHEFVQNGGLEALIKLGKTCDQNHQNHILRALGQLLLYVDGMNGVVAQNHVRFSLQPFFKLYELLDSQYRLIVKTALKLLLVFVEYTESNSLLFLAAISQVDRARKKPNWFGLMRILTDLQASDEETLMIGMTLVNKTLSGIPDQDTFFDAVDCLESQGLNTSLKEMQKLSNQQLIQQCTRYENEVQREDSILTHDMPLKGDAAMLAKMRYVGAVGSRNLSSGSPERRLIRRKPQDIDTTQMNGSDVAPRNIISQFEDRSQKVNGFPPKKDGPIPTIGKMDGKVTQRRLEMDASIDQMTDTMERELRLNGSIGAGQRNAIPANLPQNSAQVARNDEKENINKTGTNSFEADEAKAVKAPPPSIPTNLFSPTEKKQMTFPEPSKSQPPPQPAPPKEPAPKKVVVDDDEPEGPVGFAALLQKRAKKIEGSSTLRKGLLVETKASEADQKWREAAEKCKDRSQMIINDLDFTDCLEFEQDPLVLAKMAQLAQEKGLLPGGPSPASGVPPPPPMGGGGPPPPPNPMGGPPPPPGSLNVSGSRGGREPSPGPSSKGALKLHWKAAQTDLPPVPALKRKGTMWGKIQVPEIDVTKLSKLFEQKPKEPTPKKPAGEAKPQALQVLSMKRSQGINIGLTKLPPISVIPSAIRKFDQTVLNKEGIEKILSTMMPSVEEVERIREAQAENMDLPLGQAEQFLLSLSEIDCLLERLRLWVFMLDYHSVEGDVAESLKEWNDAMKEIEGSRTFKTAMGMLLMIGNAINGTSIKAFQLDFLARASETKDPVHKYTLTQHLAEYMLDKFPDGTDLYSELGAVSRCSRMDFDAISDNLKKMESDCKACFNYAEKISQKENSTSMKAKLFTYLEQVAERIHSLKLVHRTTTNRWNAFLLYLGYSATEIKDQKQTTIFKIVIEFALEYRTNRDKILQMRKRLAEKRERNKTRGMMIGMAQGGAPQAALGRHRTSVGGVDKERHQEMSRMLTGNADVDVPGRRRGPAGEKQMVASQAEAMRRGPGGEKTDLGDELLDGVVRTVTAQAGDMRGGTPRRRARLYNNKALRRTRTIRQDQLTDLNALASGNL